MINQQLSSIYHNSTIPLTPIILYCSILHHIVAYSLTRLSNPVVAGSTPAEGADKQRGQPISLILTALGIESFGRNKFRNLTPGI